MHDIVSPAGSGSSGQDGHLYVMTDTLGCLMSFSSTEEAGDHIHPWPIALSRSSTSTASSNAEQPSKKAP